MTWLEKFEENANNQYQGHIGQGASQDSSIKKLFLPLVVYKIKKIYPQTVVNSVKSRKPTFSYNISTIHKI